MVAREQIVIAGIGQTAFGKLEGRSTLSLNAEAIAAALADAGIGKDCVDALLVKYPTSQFETIYAHKVAETIGIQPRICGVLDQAGAANASMIAYAAMAIDAGQCEVAVVSFADNPKTGSRAASQRSVGADEIYGWYGAAAGYAMIAQRHMQEFGTTREQLGTVVTTCRANGAANPTAQLRKPLSMEDYCNGRPIVTPFLRDDCCLLSDGGAAVVVMSAERARIEGVKDATPILGFGQGHSAWDVTQRSDLTSTQASASSSTAFQMAGLTPEQIDIAQLYDCFSMVPLITLEDYGFCKKGSAGAYVQDIGIGLEGRLPINTSGGLLSETGMPGMQLIIEAVRQMRGTAANQIKNARNCIVSNQGGVMQTHSTLIVGQPA